MSVLQAAITEDKGLPVWWLRWTQRSRWRRSVSWSFVRLHSPEECELEKIKKDSQRDRGNLLGQGTLTARYLLGS